MKLRGVTQADDCLETVTEKEMEARAADFLCTVPRYSGLDPFPRLQTPKFP